MMSSPLLLLALHCVVGVGARLGDDGVSSVEAQGRRFLQDSMFRDDAGKLHWWTYVFVVIIFVVVGSVVSVSYCFCCMRRGKSSRNGQNPRTSKIELQESSTEKSGRSFYGDERQPNSPRSPGGRPGSYYGEERPRSSRASGVNGGSNSNWATNDEEITPERRAYLEEKARQKAIRKKEKKESKRRLMETEDDDEEKARKKAIRKKEKKEAKRRASQEP